jgi:peptide/nickel transport system substrate-binding protein
LKRIGFIVFVLMFWINCGSGDASASKSWDLDISQMNSQDNMGDWAVIHELGDPDKLHPNISSGASSTYIESHIFQTLMEMDNHTYELVPVIAAEMPVVSDDKLVYTFKLRKDVTFSDGHPLTGEDFIFSLKTIKNPFTDAAPSRNYYKDIQKAELVNGDPYTLRFICSDVYFKHLDFIGANLYAYPAHIYDPNGLMSQYSFEDLEKLLLSSENNEVESFENSDAYTFAEYFNSTEVGRNPIGSGPYLFESWKTDDRIILTRNHDYWGDKVDDTPKRNFVEKLIYKSVKEFPVALTGLKKGEIDVIRSLTPDLYYNQTNSKKFTDNYEKETFFYPSYTYIGWNNENPLFQNKLVRRAMTHLCNREQILESIYYNDGLIAKSNVYFERPEYNDTIEPWEYNPDEARRILSQEGWIDSNHDGILDKEINGELVDFTFTILTNQGNEKRKQIGLIMVEELRKVGINAGLQTMEWSVYLDNVRDHKFDAIILGWVMSIKDTDPYQIFHSSQAVGRGSNSISFKNDRADELIELNRKEFNADIRKKYMFEFQDILHEEQPYTFVVIPKSNLSYHKRFKDVIIYPFRPGFDLREWWSPIPLQKYSK